MRYPITITLLALLLRLCPQSQAGEPSLGDRLKKLAPRAAGVAQVEVVEIKEVDSRGGDGDLYLDVRLRILRGTGLTPGNIYITLARGGNPGKNSRPFKPHGPVKSDTFKKGERYWVAFSSPYDSYRCPQGVVNTWPEKDGPKDLEEAVRTDAYVHRPFYHADHNLTYSYRAANDKKSWRVRMERDGKLLWEVDLPGEKYKGAYDGEWRLLNRSQLPIDLGYEKENRTGVFLFAETASSLEDGNRYQLPAGKYRFRYALNADNGKTASISVSPMDRSDASVIQGFDPKTGKLGREERYDFLEKGGLVAGAKTEQWLRKVVRTYDVDTGKLRTEEIFRATGSSTYVPVGMLGPGSRRDQGRLTKAIFIHTPNGWMLEINSDGSGLLQFGSSASDGWRFKAGTVDAVRAEKDLRALESDSNGGIGSHFSFNFESERKAPDQSGPVRYTRDGKVIPGLLKRAADATQRGKGLDAQRWAELLKKAPPGELPNEK